MHARDHHEARALAERAHRGGRVVELLIGVLTLAACSAIPTPPAHPTAVGACTEVLGAGWQLAVEVDRAESSALALTSGDSIATCQSGKNAERTSFESTAIGSGTYAANVPPVLSYLTWSGSGDKPSILVGRVPPAAKTVRVTFPGGLVQTAAVGNGLWLAWLERPADAAPIAIEALDAAGTVITRLADPNGVEPAG